MAAPLLVANWKMNTTVAEASNLAQDIRGGFDTESKVTLVLCPPYVSLATVSDAVSGSSIKVGAQNMHFENSGAFTGEVSPTMLLGLCDYVILGHSERRQLFGESDDLINRKVLAALEHGLRPILCVGETLEEQEAGHASAVIGRQLRGGLGNVSDITSLVVAYEPVWAIGTGRAATPEIAAEMMGGTIRQTIQSLFGDAADQVPLLYGGSVNPGNIQGFAGEESIDGALVGGASLQADQFLEIARIASETMGS